MASPEADIGDVAYIPVDESKQDIVVMEKECICPKIHYGMAIMMVLIAFAAGILAGIYLSVPMTKTACWNATVH